MFVVGLLERAVHTIKLFGPLFNGKFEGFGCVMWGVVRCVILGWVIGGLIITNDCDV